MNKPQKVRIETPMGAIESDSGNHLVDVGTILVLTIALYFVVNFIKKR